MLAAAASAATGYHLCVVWFSLGVHWFSLVICRLVRSSTRQSLPGPLLRLLLATGAQVELLGLGSLLHILAVGVDVVDFSSLGQPDGLWVCWGRCFGWFWNSCWWRCLEPGASEILVESQAAAHLDKGHEEQ